MISRSSFAAALAASISLLIVLYGASPAAAFGITSFTGGTFNRDGTTASQAGSHPYAATTTFQLSNGIGPIQVDSHMKEVQLDLPPGFVGNPNVTPVACTMDQLTPGGISICPVGSQVGVISIYLPLGPGISFLNDTTNLYNMVPPAGAPAMFGFTIGTGPAVLIPHVRSGGDYGFTVDSPDISQIIGVVGVSATLWGNPSDPSHDTNRGTNRDAGIVGDIKCANPAAPPACTNPWPAGLPTTAFLTNPADCSAGPLETDLRMRSWQDPDTWHSASFDEDTNGNPTAVTGCDEVPFNPDIDLRPTTDRADSPSGLDVDLTVPTEGLLDPNGTAQAPLKRATVTLPDGMTINPASADGLGACTAQQVGLTKAAPDPRFTGAPAHCPDSAKIGTVEVKTPLLEDPLQGAVYLGAQNDPATPGDENPFGTLLSLYLAVDDPQTGIVLKLPGRVDPDPQTGQLVATFDNNPQIPFESLKLSFKTGPRAPLITPAACGSYEIVSEFTPWSAVDPDNPTPEETVTKTNTFTITSGPNGSPCPSPGQFDPAFEAGTATPIAGAYSPLVVNASRPDGSQSLRGLSVNLPPGLTGKLAGVPYCPEAAIAAAGARHGRAELASASCPAASQVGTVDVAAGAGPTPYHVQGKAYLAGPYKGAPLSLVVITPAVAGPFDLGVVPVRAALRVDPATAQITAESDPIPQILQGIPLKVRSVSVKADKPDFTLNPTDCDPMSLGGTLFGSSTSKAVSNRFQVGACKALDFEPKLKLRLKGGTRRGAYPALRAELNAKPGEANIGRVSVALPHSEFLAQNHIRTVCTRVQYAAKSCPPGSAYGHARAFTPLLDKPLEGPVYMRSSVHKLPDLVASLDGQIHIDLAGRIDSVNGGIRNTFSVVPDAPVSKFVLEMKGGKKGLLVNSRNICKQANRATVKMDGQNGKVNDFSAPLKAKCPKAPKRAGHKRLR